MKFCKDCDHHQPDDVRSYYDRCGAPQAFDSTDLVTGEKTRSLSYCDILRKPSDTRVLFWVLAPKGYCGKSAHWFEHKGRNRA